MQLSCQNHVKINMFKYCNYFNALNKFTYTDATKFILKEEQQAIKMFVKKYFI